LRLVDRGFLSLADEKRLVDLLYLRVCCFAPSAVPFVFLEVPTTFFFCPFNVQRINNIVLLLALLGTLVVVLPATCHLSQLQVAKALLVNV
jgi:hypothetical protein